jgi:predicted RNA-binding Zn ribbon-like protein
MKAAEPVIIAGRAFAAKDIIGGDAALDFINTVAGRDRVPRDWLDGYPRLLEWAELVELIPPRALRALATKAQKEPAAAAFALERAKQLREALFALITGIISGSSPPKASLALLREHWVAGVNKHELHFEAGRVIAQLRSDAADLDLIASIIAYRMIEHVLLVPPDRLRICHGPDCSWLFIDSSKGGRRRWCDMAVCGNAAKSRRFHGRTE